MKKYILLFAALVMAVAMSADGLTGKRIYVNPGHGSFGPNDRPMATISYPNLKTTGMPDTCGFYESNTNLWKCERIGEELTKQGATVVYSRTQNGPWPYEKVDGDYPAYTSDAYKALPDYEKYNRSLSEICEEVEAGNFDYFISVHSNALTDGTTTNYPLFLYRGYDDESDCNGDSKLRAQTSWPFFFECMNSGLDPYSNYSLTNLNVRGDINFYGSSSTRTSAVSGKSYLGYLGVLKHGCPGFLVEGYFHTYQPARHRALNRDYCRQEGMRHYRGIAAYYGVADTKGAIMGTVKDLHNRISNTLFNYAPKTNDQWMPCNGAVVTLYKGTKKVAEYNVDNNYNGLFVFENLEPGDDYTLDATCEGFKPLFDEYKAKISVKANATTYPMIYLEDTAYVAPTIHYENYPDPVQPSYAALAGKYLMKKSFTGTAVEALAGKTIRRALYHDGSIIVLALDANNEPLLVAVDAEKAVITDTLPTDFCSTVGGVKLNDIAFTAEGVLIGCNSEAVTFNPSNKWLIYKWEHNAAGWKGDILPTTTNNETAGNYNNALAGTTIAYSGTLDEGTLFGVSYSTGAATHGFRTVMYTFSGGAYAGAARNQESSHRLADWGDNIQYVISPNANDQYVVMDDNIKPVEYKAVAKTASAPTRIGEFPLHVMGANFFKYAGRSLMVTPTAEGVALYDITDGLDKAKLVETTNTDFTGEYTTAYAFAVVSGMDITIYLMRDNKFSKCTTVGVDQPAVPAIMAYDLNVVADGDNYKFSFYANSDATSAKIIFYDAEGAEAGSLPLNGVKAGNNEFVVKGGMLPGEEDAVYTWGVSLTGQPVTNFGKLFTDNSLIATSTSRLFNAVNTNPESPKFGHIYVLHRAGSSGSSLRGNSGIFDYNYDYTKLNTERYNGGQNFGNPARLAIDNEDYLYITDWADDHSGIFVANTADLTQTYTQFFAGTRNSAGAFDNAGVYTGSSTPGCSIYGTGADTKLFVYNEDKYGNLPSNGVAQYNIGQPDGTIKHTWETDPSATIALTGQANTEGFVRATAHGVFVSQVRTAGNNNKSATSLKFYDYAGNEQMSSAEDPYLDMIDGSNGGGFVISADESMLIMNDGSATFLVFDIAWTGDKPELTLRYSYKHGISVIRQMNWDYAGNIVCTGDANITIFSLPKADNTTLIPARKALTVKKLKAVAVTGVAFSQTTVEMQMKETLDVNDLVTVLPANATNDLITWSSTNTAVATVEDGVITAVSTGTVGIVVTTLDGGFTATLEVTVKPIAVTGVRIISGTDGRMEVGSGSNYALAFEVLPADAANKTTIWTTSNPDLITIQAQAGLVMPVAAGEAWVYVTTEDGGFRDSLYLIIDGGNIPDLTYAVTVPAGTPECYIAGEFNEWIFAAMDKVDDTHYTLTVKGAKATDGYKYTCAPDWANVEVAADGSDIDNRNWTETDVVAAWKAVPGPQVLTDLTYNVTVPEGTMECWIAGDFSEWGFLQMTKVDETHYTLYIEGSTSEQGYKYLCHNDWDYVEKGANGEELGNRTYTEADEVASWAKIWTAVDNVVVDTEVVKFVRDGQVLIRKAGKLYNMQGQEIAE